ncbi:unnamed protein product [Bursaphelenchus xylophilus]|uniref:(pine wood nematode) hypothetical protein n=1 Tax=Bursaphelenchus xylophilus TaxID=6326 RepID=A0A1I7RVB2_BURXY|nr:unnamed protein product [Bursaphelenchus xylophilus]CAG9086632.1 unnamed protein product [Bursaphelenchus xylophilus]
MSTFASKSGFSPSVAVLSSQGAENVANRNNLSFAEMLGPFSSTKVEFKDPNGRPSSITLSVDFRDIKRDGYLLSLTVLPSVLQEVVKLSVNNSNTDVWDSCFVNAFHSWFEPAEHDFLKAYLACIFVVSSEDSNALVELDHMVNQQNLQQQGLDSSLTTPAFCAPPKWFLSQILKHFVVVHDMSRGNKEQAERLSKSIKERYGSCTMLKINSGENVNLPDVWRYVNTRRAGLKTGLEVARREILASRAASNGSGPEPESVDFKIEVFGQCLSQEDRDRVESFTQGFITDDLVPFVSKQMNILNEAIVSRRGLGKSFTNMRKWLNVATTAQTSSTTGVNYASESTEMQSRRLADLAFLFGAYPFAFQLYQSLKKDFLNDQAWVQHAGTLEMAAITSYLSGASNGKNFPMHYIENSLNYYIKTSSNPLLFFRSIMFSTRLLEDLGRPQDAASFLARFIPLASMNDLFVAVATEHSATLYGRARLFRKQSFQRFLAAELYLIVKLEVIATRLLESVLTEIGDKRWWSAEDYVLLDLSKQMTEDKDIAKECAEKLLRSEDAITDRVLYKSTEHFLNFLETCGPMGKIDLIVPKLEVSTPQIYYVNQDLLSRKEYEKEEWKTLYEKAITSLKQHNPAVKHPLGIPKVMRVPVNEPVYVKIGFEKEFSFPLVMEGLALNVKSNGEVESLTIPRYRLPEYGEETPGLDQGKQDAADYITFYFTPKSVDNVYEIESLACQLSDIDMKGRVSGQIPLQIYGNKERFKVKTDKLVWPRLSISTPNHTYEEYQKMSLELYCGQVYRKEVEIGNPSETAATVTVTSEARCKFVITSDDKAVDNDGDCFKVLPRQILKLNIFILAPRTAVKSKPVRVLLSYCSAHGAIRNHLIEFSVTTTHLLKTNIRVIDRKSGLCALVVKNEVSKRSFVQIEALKLSFKSNDKKVESHVGLEKVSDRKITLEAEQEDTFCFKIKANKSSSPEINFQEIPQDGKNWPTFEDSTEKSIYFELLWKARKTDLSQTITNSYGRTRIPNPFISLSSDEKETITAFAGPKLLLKKSFEEKTSDLPGLEGTFKLAEGDIDVLSEEILQNLQIKEPKIPWAHKYAVS